MLKAIVCNPGINAMVGLILVISSGIEIFENSELGVVGSHHGVFLFGMMQTLKCLAELLHGLDSLEKAEEEREEKRNK